MPKLGSWKSNQWGGSLLALVSGWYNVLPGRGGGRKCWPRRGRGWYCEFSQGFPGTPSAILWYRFKIISLPEGKCFWPPMLAFFFWKKIYQRTIFKYLREFLSNFNAHTLPFSGLFRTFFFLQNFLKFSLSVFFRKNCWL